MAIHLYLYSPLSEVELTRQVSAHQEEFATLVGDNLSEAEADLWAPLLDELAIVTVGPILADLTFDDFIPDPNCPDEQSRFFARCRTCICLEHLPRLENNPFQVTYLKDLLWTLDEVLIDQGGMSELSFRADFLAGIKGLRTIDSLLAIPSHPPVSAGLKSPMDLLVDEVYGELFKLQARGLALDFSGESEKRQRLSAALLSGRWSAGELSTRAGLNLKDFGDALESLKFYLRKC